MKNCIKCLLIMKDSGWTLNKESRDKIKNRNNKWYEELVQVECKYNTPSPKMILYLINSIPDLKKVIGLNDAEKIKKDRDREEVIIKASENIYDNFVNENKKNANFILSIKREIVFQMPRH